MLTSAQPGQTERIHGAEFFRLPAVALAFVMAVLGAPDSLAGAPGPEPTPSNRNETSVQEDFSNPDASLTIPTDLPAKDNVATSSGRQRTMPATVLDPSARLLRGSDASESWTLYIELESGHRIAQQFLLSNAGPGDHNAVAQGYLIENGRPPYRYVNGRRRARWTLSPDRLFFDIAASHLDLHRPTGELRITKDDIEIRLFFDFAESDFARRVPNELLPDDYHVEVLAIAAATHGTILPPWMTQPLETRGHTWLVHTWTPRSEASLLDRRIEFYAYDNETSFYGIHLRNREDFQRAWLLSGSGPDNMIESSINIPTNWLETTETKHHARTCSYPVPDRFTFSGGSLSGQITLGQEWLRFDPLAVLPQPFRWFVRRKTKPEQVWADARIGVRLSPALENPSLPDASEAESDSNSKRETEDKTAERSVTGVASITFFNPSERR